MSRRNGCSSCRPGARPGRWSAPSRRVSPIFCPVFADPPPPRPPKRQRRVGRNGRCPAGNELVRWPSPSPVSSRFAHSSLEAPMPDPAPPSPPPEGDPLAGAQAGSQPPLVDLPDLKFDGRFTEQARGEGKGAFHTGGRALMSGLTAARQAWGGAGLLGGRHPATAMSMLCRKEACRAATPCGAPRGVQGVPTFPLHAEVSLATTGWGRARRMWHCPRLPDTRRFPPCVGNRAVWRRSAQWCSRGPFSPRASTATSGLAASGAGSAVGPGSSSAPLLAPAIATSLLLPLPSRHEPPSAPSPRSSRPP